MVLSARFFVYTGILVTFCVISSIRSHTISLPTDDKDYTNVRIKVNENDTSSTTIPSQNSVTTSSLNSTTSTSQHVESNDVDERPPKTTPPSTIHRKTTLSSKKQTVVENPHELSVANVEKFVKGYFARRNRNATLLSAEPTEAPSVKHILQVISPSTEQSPAANAGPTSKESKVDDLIAIIPPGPIAAPLAAEKKRIALGTGNIIGIVIGVLVLMVGFIYAAVTYFPKARRRSSYTEMFINDTENEEEISLADYSEARGDNNDNL